MSVGATTPNSTQAEQKAPTGSEASNSQQLEEPEAVARSACFIAAVSIDKTVRFRFAFTYVQVRHHCTESHDRQFPTLF